MPARGYKLSEEAKKKMSLAKMGDKNPMKKQEVRQKVSESLKGKKPWNKGTKGVCTGWLKGKPRPTIRGERNHEWKGNEVGYHGLHLWVSRYLGKPMQCSNCKTLKAKKFEWANKSREYKRDLRDWIRLCTKCHRAYDSNKIKLYAKFNSKTVGTNSRAKCGDA